MDGSGSLRPEEVERNRGYALRFLETFATDQPAGQVAVVYFAENPRVISEPAHPEVAARRLRNARLAAGGNTGLAAALETARQMLAVGGDTDFAYLPKVYLVVGDGQHQNRGTPPLAQTKTDEIISEGGMVWYLQAQVTNKTPAQQDRLRCSGYLDEIPTFGELMELIRLEIEISFSLLGSEDGIQAGETLTFVMNVGNPNSFPIWWEEFRVSLRGLFPENQSWDLGEIRLEPKTGLQISRTIRAKLPRSGGSYYGSKIQAQAESQVAQNQWIWKYERWGPIEPLRFALPESVSVIEGETVNVEVTLDRPVPEGATVTVDYTTANGSAGADSDYVAVSGTLTFEQGERSVRTASIETIQDFSNEGGETFKLVFSNPQHAMLRPRFTEPWEVPIVIDDIPIINYYFPFMVTTGSRN
ncbi:Calx-beta domain-containing protein [Patescibacteria group bacterium]